jgi:hypothetical protein
MAEMTAQRFKDRFRHFSGQPQQYRGLGILYDELAQLPGGTSLLQEDSLWAEEFSNTPPPAAPGPGTALVPMEGEAKAKGQNPLLVPFFSQLDNRSGTGWRECFSSAIAMIASYHGKIDGDDEWNDVRSRFGDTTSACAQLAALRHVGLSGSFRTNGNWRDLVSEIDQGFPVGVGYLHHGPASAPRGGGHWATIVGHEGDTHFVVHDPYGVPNLVDGGFRVRGGDGSFQSFSRKNFGPRWMVEGPGTGWFMTVRP